MKGLKLCGSLVSRSLWEECGKVGNTLKCRRITTYIIMKKNLYIELTNKSHFIFYTKHNG